MACGRVEKVIELFQAFDDAGTGLVSRAVLRNIFASFFSEQDLDLLLDELEKRFGVVADPNHTLPYVQVVNWLCSDVPDVRKVTICGGGHAAHVMAVLVPSLLPNTEVNVLTIRGDRSQVWTTKLSEVGRMTLLKIQNDERSTLVARPSLVTNDAKEAMKGCDMVFLCLPAFAHEVYLKTVSPHVEAGTCIVGMPAYPGFMWLVRHAFGMELAAKVNVIGTDTLPWACRFTEYGNSVLITGTKQEISICGGGKGDEAKVQACFGTRPKLKHVPGLMSDIGGPNPIVHPAIMFGRWHAWDGAPLAEAPLFYHGVDAFTADAMSAISDELIVVRDELTKLCPGQDLSDVIHIFPYAVNAYRDQMEDISTLQSSLVTNAAFKGLTHPMKMTDEGMLEPDFGHRYFTEDVPIGLVPLRGISKLVGVETPMMDRVILWCQERMGKEYLKDGDLNGEDIGEARAPARFGITSVDHLIW